jgi:hypothetical protein
VVDPPGAGASLAPSEAAVAANSDMVTSDFICEQRDMWHSFMEDDGRSMSGISNSGAKAHMVRIARTITHDGAERSLLRLLEYWEWMVLSQLRSGPSSPALHADLATPRRGK